MSGANFFREWGEKDQWTLADAATLLVGEEPTGYDPTEQERAKGKLPSVSSYPPDLPGVLAHQFQRIMRAAFDDLGTKLRTGWETRSPVLPANLANNYLVYVFPGDVVDWAKRRRFKVPEKLRRISATLKRSQIPGSKAAGEAELEELLQDIEARAKKAGEIFKRNPMPGTKDQFKRIIKERCPSLMGLAGATLDQYMKDAGCKFRHGRNTPATDLWKRLFS